MTITGGPVSPPPPPTIGAKQLSREGAFAFPFFLSPQSYHNGALSVGAFQAKQGQPRGGGKDMGQMHSGEV